MIKSNKTGILSFMIGVFCLINSAVARIEQSQTDETPNKQATASKVVVLYNDGSISPYRDNLSFLENQPATHWHEESENNDTVAQAQMSKQVDSQHELKEVKATPVPEPTLFSMLLAGMGLLLLWSKLFRNRDYVREPSKK